MNSESMDEAVFDGKSDVAIEDHFHDCLKLNRAHDAQEGPRAAGTSRPPLKSITTLASTQHARAIRGACQEKAGAPVSFASRNQTDVLVRARNCCNPTYKGEGVYHCHFHMREYKYVTLAGGREQQA